MFLNKFIKFSLVIVFFLTISVSQGMVKNDQEANKKLFEAAKTNDCKLIKKLVNSKANVNAVDESGDNILMALSDQKFPINQLLLDVLLKQKIDPKFKNEEGKTALMYAAKNGNLKMVDYLLQIGSDVNAGDKDGWTSLIYATEFNKNLEIIQNLLKAGAKVNLADLDGITPLMHAAFNGKLEVVQLLISKGADINLVSQSGHTAYSFAKMKHHEDIEKFLKQWQEISMKPELEKHMIPVLSDIVIDYLY